MRIGAWPIVNSLMLFVVAVSVLLVDPLVQTAPETD
jgi:hypothetical protein